MSLQFLKHHEIDFASWDACVDKAVNGSIFVYSWYLNYVAPNWCAIVDDQYTCIMPIPVTEHWRHWHSTTPALCLHLGIVFTKPVREAEIRMFIDLLPDKIRRMNLVLSKMLPLANSNNSLFSFKRKVYSLDLIRNYGQLQKLYTKELKERIGNTEKRKYNIIGSLQLIDMLQLFFKNRKTRGYNKASQLIREVRRVGLHALRISAGDIVGAYDADNSLCAAALFVSSHNKAYLIFSTQTKAAAFDHVPELMVDYFIRKHSEKNLTLIVADRLERELGFSRFGAAQTAYPTIVFDHSPWYDKLFGNLGNDTKPD